MMRKKGWYLVFKYRDALREPGEQIVEEWLKLDAENEAEADKKTDEKVRQIKDHIKNGVGKYATKKDCAVRGIFGIMTAFIKPKE